MEKFCLNWNGYDANIRDSLKKLRDNHRLFDVTLVSDDGQHIQAHKIILSAGSNFFSDIFSKSNHSNMLVYLKGISSVKLEPIIDFIYDGEVSITQEQIKMFIKTGKELLVKGLDDELTGISENTDENLMDNQKSEYTYEKYEDTDLGEDTVALMDKGSLQLRTNNTLDQQIDEMIEKNEGAWKCKICGKISGRKDEIRSHTEIHIDGMSHSCHVCSKTFKNRPGLNTHILSIHSELFSCDICERTGMNRKAYRNHKLKHHN